MATVASPSRPFQPRRDTLAPALQSASLSFLVLVVLCGLWEAYKWVGERAEITWPFPVNERTMPHVYDMVGQLFEPSRRNGPLLIDVLLDAAALHRQGGRGRVRARRERRLRDRRRALRVAAAPARLPALHRRLADDPDPRDRADGRRLDQPEAARVARRLGRGLRDLRLPDLLPGHDQHAPRAPVGRSARGRADALVRREPLEDPLEAPRPRLVPVPLHGAEDRRAAPRSWARSSASCPRRSRTGSAGAILNFNQYYVSSPPSLWATNIIAAALGILFFAVVAIAERLLVHRAPENVA